LCKINIDNCPLEQVRHFNYLGCDVTYDQDEDIHNKLHKFQNICGTIWRNLKKKTRKDKQLKFYKTMPVPVLMYGSEAWVIKKNDTSRIQSAEMKLLRSVKGCTRMDHIRNEDIRTELEMYAIQGKSTEYRIRWSAENGHFQIAQTSSSIQTKGKKRCGPS
jgi:hypothetical protein